MTEKPASKVWELLSEYIASENVIYSEDAMEYLCECVLPNIWGEVGKLEKSLDDKTFKITGALLLMAREKNKVTQLELENEALGVLLSDLVDIEAERNTLKAALSVAMNENQRLTKTIE